MTFLQTTQLPNATLQSGLISNIVVGAVDADNALSDGSDASYLWLNARASLDSQVTRVSITPPVLTGVTRVYSVDIQVRMLSVLEDTNQPELLLWLRTQSGPVTVAGQTAPVSKTSFSQVAPTDSSGGNWTTLDLGSFIAAPDGSPWDPTPTTGNLANLSIDLGRGDDYAALLQVASLIVTVNYQQQATVTLTGPVNGSDTSPTMVWSYASANFADQQASRKAVYPLASTLALGFAPFVSTPLFISGSQGASVASSWWELGPAQQWVLPGDLTDGTYVGYVQAISQWPGAGGDFTTPISSITWTRTGAPAGPPPAAVLNSAAYSYNDQRTYVTFTPGTGTVAATVLKSTDGVSFAPVSPGLTRFAVSGTSAITVADRFPLLNAPTIYQVVAYSGSPLVAASAPSNQISATAVDNRWMLHHPDNDLLDTDIVIKSPKGDDGIKWTKQGMSATYYYTGGPTNQALPGMTFGPNYGWQIELNLWCDMVGRPDLWPAIDQLDEERSPLYVLIPDGTPGMWIGMTSGQGGQGIQDDVKPVAGQPSANAWKRRKVTLTQTNAPATFT